MTPGNSSCRSRICSASRVSTFSSSGIGWYGEPVQQGLGTSGPAGRDPLAPGAATGLPSTGDSLLQHRPPLVLHPGEAGPVHRDDQRGLVAHQRAARRVEDLPAHGRHDHDPRPGLGRPVTNSGPRTTCTCHSRTVSAASSDQHQHLQHDQPGPHPGHVVIPRLLLPDAGGQPDHHRGDQHERVRRWSRAPARSASATVTLGSASSPPTAAASRARAARTARRWRPGPPAPRPAR